MFEPSSGSIAFSVNAKRVSVAVSPAQRLAKVLREELGLTGTKVGCDAGDCGACTVLIDGAPACACLVALGQVDGREVVTVEGIARHTRAGDRLRAAFARTGAAQCGICTPGMLVAACALLEKNPAPSEGQVLDALGGVLCRCTGYRKIIDAVMAAGRELPALETPRAGAAVGARIARIDGPAKLDGSEVFGADYAPCDSLLARAVRSPYHRARFHFGDLSAFAAAHDGIAGVFTARDVPGENRFGVLPQYVDQPAFAEEEARFRGEAVALLVGDPRVIESLDLAKFPVQWQELPALTTVAAALASGAPLVHTARRENVLVRGRVVRGDVDAALQAPDVVVAEGEFETGFIEHAYIEPEAGFACRVGDRIEIQACTQSPYMDRDGVARLLGIAPERVRIIPTAVGGGFGSKLDLSLQPMIAVAAWHLRCPVRMVYSRTESMMSTTKRHPARMRMRAGARADGKLVAIDFSADFNTGAYASWGPTVAGRVPVHASGPYFVPHYRALTRAVHTHLVPSGAFRGFGVPQTVIAQEQIFDQLADRLNIDRLEFRIRNALEAHTPTGTGQILGGGVGIRKCFEALRPRWTEARAAAAEFNAQSKKPLRRGMGVAGMWYGCGNTALPNPSTIRAGLKPDGRIALHQGAVDIGQGSNTVITQIFADAMRAPLERIDLISADTDLTPDAGKTSASRQTFVSGSAAHQAGIELRRAILRWANGIAAHDDASISFEPGLVKIAYGDMRQTIDLGRVPVDRWGYVVTREATFDPPVTTLDSNGQGVPYAAYGFGAHLAEVEVDMELGLVRVLKITAAHDVGRAINPTLIEGQIEGGVAQGIGLALMEEFFPGRGENLHDYLIPSIGDVPPIESILIEDPAPVGPLGVKGIGEQALIPTAPAILNAIHDAAGIRIRKVPATPDRVRAAILAAAGDGDVTRRNP